MSAIEFPIGPSKGQEHPHTDGEGNLVLWVCDAVTPAVMWSRKETVYVKADGTVAMTGQLTITPSAPTADSHAARKDYVDDRTGFLAEINKIINANVGTADVFIYDTAQDDDGGAWVDKSNWQSWYGEVGDFPKLAVLVCDTVANKLYIMNGNNVDLPIWLTFDIQDTNMLSGNVANRSITAKNGQIFHATGAINALQIADFINDTGWFIDTAGWSDYLGNITQRNSNLGHNITPIGEGLSSNICNNVSVFGSEMGNTIVVNTDLGTDNLQPDKTAINLVNGTVQLDGFITEDAQVSIEQTTGNVYIWEKVPNADGATPDITLNSSSSPTILGTAVVTCPMYSDNYAFAVGSSTGLTLVSLDLLSTVEITVSSNSGGGDNLAGASDSIIALDFDSKTNLLSVCSGDTISKFNGLNLVSSSTEVATCISTVCEKQVVGN